MSKYEYIFGLDRYVLEIDTSDEETPAMVYVHNEIGNCYASGTWDCATQAGDLDGYPLPVKVIAWLEGYQDQVEKAYEIARANW